MPTLSVILQTENILTYEFSNDAVPSLPADLEAELRSVFSVPQEMECRVWHLYMTNKYELLTTPTLTLKDAGLYNGQVRDRGCGLLAKLLLQLAILIVTTAPSTAHHLCRQLFWRRGMRMAPGQGRLSKSLLAVGSMT